MALESHSVVIRFLDTKVSLFQIARLTEEDARMIFEQVRWGDNDGEPWCPKCGSVSVGRIRTRQTLKCHDCKAQFTITSGTPFANKKLSYRDYLLVIASFVINAKGISSIQLAKYLGVQQVTAYKLQRKMRGAMLAEQERLTLSGEVEVDGAFFGGYKKAANVQRTPSGNRRMYYKRGVRKVVVVARQRHGRTLTTIVNRESEAVFWLKRVIAKGSIVFADGAHAFDSLANLYELLRIHHNVAWSHNGASTNWAESFFSRLRRLHMGTYHRISGRRLKLFAAETAWREDHRKLNLREATLSLLGLVLAQNDTVMMHERQEGEAA